MADFFGTDGIRGEFGKNLTCKLAFCAGNALTQIKNMPKVVIGRDTRLSGDCLVMSVSAGLLQGGADVTYVGIIPTAGISFLTASKEFDFGIIITASHNPKEFNGIKIFDQNGKKLCESMEDFLENFFSCEKISTKPGKFVCDNALQKAYEQHLANATLMRFDNLKVCLDASCGAGGKIAPKVFKKLGAKVTKLSCKLCGEKINDHCGCLFLKNLVEKVKKTNADVGFAFDGDADRVIAVGKSGEVFDGDKLLYILAKDMKSRGQLFANSVVGTSHTNSGIMAALNRHKINLVRTDIGDKYVIEAMEKMNLTLGGEQSGHIIIKSYAQTGDGILTAIKICEIMKKEGQTLEQLFDAKLTFQCNINLSVKDKIKVVNNEQLILLVGKILTDLSPVGRVLVRASGTEDKVRIMVEHPDQEKAISYGNQIKELILSI